MTPKKTDKAKLTLAERAYLKWLERGGGHGNDMEDWLAAERELNETKAPKAPAGRKTAAKPRPKKSN